MVEIVCHVRDDKGNPVFGADIKATWRDWLSAEQEATGKTNTIGNVTLAIGVLATAIHLTATKSGSRDESDIFVNWFGGIEPPNPQQFVLVFDPLGGARDAWEDFYKDLQDFLSSNGRILVIVGGITFAAVSAYLIYKYIKGGEFVSTGSKVGAAAASGARKVAAGAKKTGGALRSAAS